MKEEHIRGAAGGNGRTDGEDEQDGRGRELYGAEGAPVREEDGESEGSGPDRDPEMGMASADEEAAVNEVVEEGRRAKRRKMNEPTPGTPREEMPEWWREQKEREEEENKERRREGPKAPNTPEVVRQEEEQQGEIEESSETRTMKEIPNVYEPTAREREEHEVTHGPYRNWCRYCVQGRGRENHHRKEERKTHREIPLVAMDYCFMGKQDEAPETILVVKDERSKAMKAYNPKTKRVR